MASRTQHIKFEEDIDRSENLMDESSSRAVDGLREGRAGASELADGRHAELSFGDVLEEGDEDIVRLSGGKRNRRGFGPSPIRRRRAEEALLKPGEEGSDDSSDEVARQISDAARTRARKVRRAPSSLSANVAALRNLSAERRALDVSRSASDEADAVLESGDRLQDETSAHSQLKNDGRSALLSEGTDPDSPKRRGKRRAGKRSPFAGLLKRRAMRAASARAQAGAARRAAKAVKRGVFGLKAALGAVAGLFGFVILLFSIVGVAMLMWSANDPTTEPAGSIDLPDAVEMWRGECKQACIDVLGDEKWTDLMLAMMAQESGGSLDVLCFPGGVKRQDIMQACEGAYGSWILHGGGPYSLVACTPRASIYAGAAELKQNLSLWAPYLGGIDVHEVEKIELVVQGYNFGAQGWFNWNKRHGYKSYTLAHAQNYSDSVMPAGAKGTPSHAEKVMKYYPWANAGTANGNTTVARAYMELGKPYLWGAVGPSSYDCSGLVSYCLTGKHERIGTTETFATWKRVATPEVGDICLNSHHCGIYIGEGKMIHAPHTGDVVKISDVHVGMYYVRY